MIDIFAPSESGLDCGVSDTDTAKAANILSVQLGNLVHLPDFGVDIDYFLTEDVAFENQSFKSYLVEALANQGISVTSLISEIESFFNTFTFEVQANESNSQLVAR